MASLGYPPVHFDSQKGTQPSTFGPAIEAQFWPEEIKCPLVRNNGYHHMDHWILQ